MNMNIEKITDHYIICGFNNISRGICYKLKEEKIPFVVIESDKASKEYAYLRNYNIIIDDPTNDATLIAAGIENAKGIVNCLSNDSENLYITLAARELNHKIYIISCSSDPSKENRMRRAGADLVVYPEYLGGEQIAKIMHKEDFNTSIVYDNVVTPCILGYSLKMYKHLDNELLLLKELLKRTSAIKAVAVKRGIDFILKVDDNFQIENNDLVVLAVNSKHKAEGKEEVFRWSSKYSVGIVSIDKEHKKIIDLINKIIDSKKDKMQDFSLENVLEELLDYAVEHFKHEEEMFEQYKYPDADEHKSIHKEILDNVSSLFEQTKFLHKETLYNFLKNWVINHFCIVDMKYSEYLKLKGVK